MQQLATRWQHTQPNYVGKKLAAFENKRRVQEERGLRSEGMEEKDEEKTEKNGERVRHAVTCEEKCFHPASRK